MDHKQQAKFDLTINESTVTPAIHSKVDIMQFITDCCSNFAEQVNLTDDGDELTLIIDEIQSQDYKDLDKELRDQTFFTVNHSAFGS